MTFFAAALTKRPSLRLSASQADLFASAAEITCVNKDDTDPSADGSFFSTADEAWTGAIAAADRRGIVPQVANSCRQSIRRAEGAKWKVQSGKYRELWTASILGTAR